MGNEVPPRSSSLLGLLIASTLGSFLKRLSELAQGPGTLGSALSCRSWPFSISPSLDLSKAINSGSYQPRKVRGG